MTPAFGNLNSSVLIQSNNKYNYRLRNADLQFYAGLNNKFPLGSSFVYGSIPLVTIPPGTYPGDLPLFSYWAVYSSPPSIQKETLPHPWDSPLVTHCTQTQKRNNVAFCVQNQDNNIYFCAKPYHKHIRNMNTRCREYLFNPHQNSRFFCFLRCISVLLLV